MKKSEHTRKGKIDNVVNWASDQAAQQHNETQTSQWDERAKSQRKSGGPRLSRYYHNRLLAVYRAVIPTGSKVLEIGCGKGHLLAGLNPSLGVGVDFSAQMINEATAIHPGLRFIHADAHNLDIDEKFDYIILSDVINDVWNMQKLLEQLTKICTYRTRLILNNYSRLWELPLGLVERLHLGNPQLQKNWLAPGELINLLDISGYQSIRHWEEILLPIYIPGLSSALNRFLVKIWPFKFFALTKFMIARPNPDIHQPDEDVSASIIVPARNEAGHVEELFKRLPDIDVPFELVFVEGHSEDDTFGLIEKAIRENANYNCRLLRQTGNGKHDAVELGISKSQGDIIVILDADLTVAPEDIPQFLRVIRDRRGEFINGVRMVYPQEKDAMRFFNLLGNKFFALVLSKLLGQRIGDSLCGTKVFWKKDYDIFSNEPSYLGKHDPFGDFALLFGAAKLNLRIVDVPVRYRKRSYGETNIHRWRDGWKLFQMLIKGALRNKFV